MKRKTTKRVLSGFLAVLMVFSILFRQASDLLTGIYKGLLQRLTIQCFYPEAGTFHPKEEINNFAEIAEDYLTHRK